MKKEKLSIKTRCKWAAEDPLMEEYHDFYWNVPAKNDNELFERMTQQIFQAGLSWRMIWAKHKAFHKAFHKFSLKKVAGYTIKDFTRLTNDATIVRNKAKIKATIENAKLILEVKKEYGSFQKFLDTIPNDLSACQQEMKKRFKFMGPEITRMFVFNIGKLTWVHEKECWMSKGMDAPPHNM